jgi:leucyl-tRNA synthetase
VPRDASEEQALTAALAEESVRRFAGGKEIRKVVYVPNRLINVVV